MKFYRTFTPFSVISFDLDDTLYDNTEIIKLAMQEFIALLREKSQIAELDDKMWGIYRNQVFQQDPIGCEDVTQWRINTIQVLLQEQGKTAVEIERISQNCIDHFLHWRHQINIPQQSIDVLNQLKQHFRLVAITNGNVEPERIGLEQFDLVLTGGVQGRAKPEADLFHQTARYFGIKSSEILHVGDHLVADVQGAIQAGCQAVWLNLSGKGIGQFSEARLLPSVEMADLTELLLLQG
ncbi:HAD-IA family hydrolase [Lonepinella koalarum]|uniref:Putative hydrolase of the HAD superfamily n=1 Tax=Lonepinella koalarum TaxID=53417 RepID=A0A4R1KUL9_9PAST|nr:HAD-IA family hydrolase [Lonepinella koalarum]MDH2927511.1 HAD family hydrolase [Lonepinella koalarum]TCK68347.1 putative hydrolase of the HAD superfamily [Lonepinella koalarum]TFJ89603.1 HAD family hydrolase [Lonepinella koalarum]